MRPLQPIEHSIIAAANAYDHGVMLGDVTAEARMEWRCELCDHATRVEAFARVTVSGHAATVAFRGTDSGLDWWANTDMRRCMRHAGFAHAGFAHAHDSIAATIAKALKPHQISSLTLTGHSLGGAMAAIAALAAREAYPGCHIDLVTFGSPRCLSASLAARLESDPHMTIARYVNGPDPVTWLPPLASSYRHAGDAIQLRRCAAALAVANWFAGRLLHRRYHPLSAYWTALQEARHA